MKTIVKIIEWINAQAGLLAGIACIILTLTVTIDVAGRYLFRKPMAWGFESDLYLLAFISLIGGGYTMLVDGHIRVDLIYAKWSPKTRAWIDIFTYILGLSFLLVLMWQGWLLAYKSLIHGYRSAHMMAWPLFPSQVLVPLGAALIMLQFLIRIGRSIALVRQKSTK